MMLHKNILFYLLFSIVTIGYLYNAFAIYDIQNINIEIACSNTEAHESLESSAEEEIIHGIKCELHAPIDYNKSIKSKYISLVISDIMFSIWNPPKLS